LHLLFGGLGSIFAMLNARIGHAIIEPRRKDEARLDAKATGARLGGTLRRR
jgi:hypothetical protein